MPRVRSFAPIALLCLGSIAGACGEDDAPAVGIAGQWLIESDERSVSVVDRDFADVTTASFEEGALVVSFDIEGRFREAGEASYSYENRLDERLVAVGQRELVFATEGTFEVSGDRINVTITQPSPGDPYDLVRRLRFELDGDRMILLQREEDRRPEGADTVVRTLEVLRHLRRVGR